MRILLLSIFFSTAAFGTPIDKYQFYSIIYNSDGKKIISTHHYLKKNKGNKKLTGNNGGYPAVVCERYKNDIRRVIKNVNLFRGFSMDYQHVSNGLNVDFKLSKVLLSPDIIFEQKNNICKPIIPKAIISKRTILLKETTGKFKKVKLQDGHQFVYRFEPCFDYYINNGNSSLMAKNACK